MKLNIFVLSMLLGVSYIEIPAQDMSKRMDPEVWLAQENISDAVEFGRQLAATDTGLDWICVRVDGDDVKRPRGAGDLWHRMGDLRLVLDSAGFNLSRSHNIGFNYGAYEFSYRGRLMALGGLGFWEQHAKLIEFSPATGEWERLAMGIGPGFVKASGCWLTGDMSSVVAVSHETEQDPDDGVVWELDLTSYQWEPLGRLTEVFSSFHPGSNAATLETEDYVLWVRQNQSVVIRKADLKAVLTTDWLRTDLAQLKPEPDGVLVTMGRGNQIQWWRPSDVGEPVQLTSLDVGELFEGATRAMQPTALMTPMSPSVSDAGREAGAGWPWERGLILLTLGFGLVVGWAVGRRRQVPVSLESTGSSAVKPQATDMPLPSPPERQVSFAAKTRSNPEVDALEALGMVVMSSAELNAHLELDNQLSSESRRARRAQFIREVNREYQRCHGVDLIFREQDSNDRRRTHYVIRPH